MTSRIVMFGWIIAAAGLTLAAAPARADSCTGYLYQSAGRYDNTASGDVVGVALQPTSLLTPAMNALGPAEQYTHIFAMYDASGAYITQQQFDFKQIGTQSCSSPLSWQDLGQTGPGIGNGVLADSDAAVRSLQPGTVLEGGAVPGCFVPPILYQIHGLVDRLYNRTCSEMLVDSCGSPGAAKYYGPDQVLAAGNAMYNTIYTQCMSTGLPILAKVAQVLGVCDSHQAICGRAANQTVNQILWNNGACHEPWQFNCGNNPSGAIPPINTISPSTIITAGVAAGKHTHVAHIVPAGYYCPNQNKVYDTCMTAATNQAEQLGSGNINGYYAGLYDYYCGYYLNNGGNDFGYCAQANSYARLAGVHTAGTGTSPYGTFYNYSAGLNDYYCRYYEYNGYGWNYGGYCDLAANYAQYVTGCGQPRPCTPTCSGVICGSADGCGTGGTCAAGSGCCTPSCSGTTCGSGDGCGGSCVAGSGCTSPPPVSQLYPPKGWVDGYNTSHVWGWACDPDYPTQSNRVDVYTTGGVNLGSSGAYLGSSAAIAGACGGGSAHYFDFYPPGGVASGTHINVYSIDLPYATPGNVNVMIGGQGSIGAGTEFVIP